MRTDSTYNPEEQHIALEELERYIAGDLDADRAEQVARHLADCDMCSDTLEGLLALDSPEGLQQQNQRLYADFRKKNLKPEDKKRTPGPLANLNRTNSLLLALVGILLLSIIFSIIFLSLSKDKEPEQNTEANRVDSLVAYNPSIMVEQDTTQYVPDTAAVDSSIAKMMTDPNIDYEYYDEDARGVPAYTPQYHEEIYVSYRPQSQEVTNYGSSHPTDNDHTTSQEDYFGYNRNLAQPKPAQKKPKVQVGNQLLEVDDIVQKAQSYYQEGNYKEGIYFLDKYARNIRESIPDIDYWLARMYAADDQMSHAKYYLERLAGYQNPYTQRAKKMLGQN